MLGHAKRLRLNLYLNKMVSRKMSILEKGKEKKFKIKIVFAFKLSKKYAFMSTS